MVDLTGLKRTQRKNLGTPPSMDEASKNLQAPEVAPATSGENQGQDATPPAVKQSKTRVDARSFRRTDRTVNFATRVTPAWDKKIRQISVRDKLMLTEILEHALEAYEEKHSRGTSS